MNHVLAQLRKPVLYTRKALEAEAEDGEHLHDYWGNYDVKILRRQSVS